MRLAILLAVAAGGLWLAVTPEAGQGSGASRTDRARTGAPPSGNHRGGYLPPAPKPAGSPQGRRDQGFTPRAPYMKAACELPWRWALETYRGWRPGPSRSTDLITIPSSRNYMGTWYTTSHAGPYGYLQKVPLVFYGPGFVKSMGDFKPSDRVSLTDVAPTVAQLLGLEMPNATGSSVSGILKAKATAPPKLVLTVTIDGGGWNVLNRWPDAWPHLKGIMSKGASLEGVRVGSSPSVTPPIHANISTGTWPRRHGSLRSSCVRTVVRSPGHFVTSTTTVSYRSTPTETCVRRQWGTFGTRRWATVRRSD